MVVFPPPINFFNQPHLGITTLLFKCQNKITEKSLKIAFSGLVTSYMSRSTYFESPSVYIYILIIKVKAHEVKIKKFNAISSEITHESPEQRC